MITVRIPAPSNKLFLNLLGVLGLVGIAVAVGGLTGNPWWALLIASVEVFAVAFVATYNLEAVEAGADEFDLDDAPARPRAV